MRLVVDTNLMIRALLSPGPARQFFKLAPLVHQLHYAAEQLAELRDVAARPRLKLAPQAVDELIERIAEEHNGQIGVRSDVGKGSDFFITLPVK